MSSSRASNLPLRARLPKAGEAPKTRAAKLARTATATDEGIKADAQAPTEVTSTRSQPTVRRHVAAADLSRPDHIGEGTTNASISPLSLAVDVALAVIAIGLAAAIYTTL